MKAFFAILILVALLSQGLQAGCGDNVEAGAKVPNYNTQNPQIITKTVNDKNGRAEDAETDSAKEETNVAQNNRGGVQDEVAQNDQGGVQDEVAQNNEVDERTKLETHDSNINENPGNIQKATEIKGKQKVVATETTRVLFGKEQQVNPTVQTPNPLTTELEVFRKKISGLII